MGPYVREIQSQSRGCLVLTHPEIQPLEIARKEIVSATGLPVVSIGLGLSNYLLDVQRGERSRAIQNWFSETIQSLGNRLALYVDIDILFAPEFTVDPLALFRHAGRILPLAVLWPGNYQDRILSYAVPTHQHYRIWTNPDVTVFPITI